MGDGNFKWWWGYGTEPETCHGPFDSREAAITDANGADGNGFTIMEADKAVPTYDIFDAGQVFERFIECNEEVFHEDDGVGGPSEVPVDRELEIALMDVFRKWVETHDAAPAVWYFGVTRSQQYILPEKEAA